MDFLTLNRRENTDNTHPITDLPIEDIVVKHIAPYLTIEDILNFRKSFQHNLYMIYMAERMFDALRSITIDKSLMREPGDISAIIRNSRQLRHIEISIPIEEEDEITDESVSRLLRGNRFLRTIYIDGCWKLTSEAFWPLIDTCLDVVELCIPHVTLYRKFIKALYEVNQNLTKVQFSNPKKNPIAEYFIGDDDMMHIIPW
ncbi:uncharacterized protein LOC129793597 isoform X2 [Lutzomyia longipalpis]|uniref:uncharacterized protein LOC129793597 isoform X2 n=1 Tax=Lutzomyia longipalpis TaxID=7200 RepID=UPI0024844F24|nr:uncharacterized protein LOC129793597 isoform X2 [Lutzomyia longipalpis]